MPRLALDTVRSYVGDGVGMLTKRALPGLGEEELKAGLEQLRAHYRAHLMETTRPYPGISKMLESLAGIHKAVLTNKPEEFSRKILEGLGLASHFEVVWGGDTGPRKKPDPEPVTKILERFNCEPAMAVLVGDSANDIKAAKGAGTRSLAVGYGYTGEAALKELGPDYFASSPEEITRLLLSAG